ncbi:hypothetical protein RSAG8_06390, partial [Rhizoctonia solani AG-8 WAC10335]
MEVLAKDPKASGKHGTKAFKFLETVTEAINESRSNTPKLKLQLRVTGKTTPLSHRCNTSRPDGYFHMNTVNLSSTVNWGDIVMPMEFKNADNEENKIDDYAKVMWSMHHVMRMDARRRYVHGLTCENTKARLWYNDRSDVVASEFDVNKDWRCLVRIILSILLATDAELGYDPNVVARPFNSVYDITIHGEPVHSLRKFTDIITAIQGGWEGLHAIHLCDHVHRDVSSSNILLVPASDGFSERGVIMDLEYVKDVNDMKAPRDVRVGTEAFMATEVAFMEHYRLSELCLTNPGSTLLQAMVAVVMLQTGKMLIAMYSMFWLVPSGSRQNASDWENAYRNVFRNRDAKKSFIQEAGTFANRTSHRSELRSLVATMELWRATLNDSYSVSYRQQDALVTPLTMIQIDSSMIKISYELGQEFLQDLQEASKQLTITFVPLPRALKVGRS